MSVYLDTHVAVWLAQGDLSNLSPAAVQAISTARPLLSPMVLLELEYLFELDKILLSAADIQRKLEFELSACLCDFSFPEIAKVAWEEKWARDRFDRLIVAHARANNFSTLITADAKIHENYPRAVW